MQVPSLRNTAASGAKWALAGFAASQTLRLATNIVIAGLLIEESFALMGLVGAVIQGLAMFSDIGLGLSVVQSKRGDDQKFLDTAWTLQLLRGLLLAAIAVGISFPMASMLERHDPAAAELRLLMPLVALSVLVDGFQSTKLRTAARHLRIRVTVCIELACQFAAAASSILIAYATHSVYALAFGGLASSLLMLVLGHLAIRGPGNRLTWDKECVRELLSFGQWILLSTIITFLALQLDRFVFTVVFPLREVGVYSIAAGLGILVPSLMGKLQSTLAMPLYSRMLGRGTPMKECLLRVRRPMTSLGGYLVCGVIACSPALIDAAYTDNFRMAGVYLPILAAGAWFAGMDGTYGAAFLAMGRGRAIAMVNFTKVASFSILLVPGIHWGGLTGAVIALAASDAIKFLVTARLVATSFGMEPIRKDIRATAFVAMIALPILFGGKAVAESFGIRALPLLLGQMALVTLAFAPFLLEAKRLTASSRATDPTPT